MRICKRNTFGLSSIPKTGTVYLTDDPALPISETPFWFKDLDAAQDLWASVKCERLTNLYELEPIYKFLADKYNWQFPANAEKQDAIKWLRANGIIVKTPEEEARDLEAARNRLNADLAEIKRINAIKDPVEREAAAKAFRERRDKR
jgi:TRAP-type C4-dicarboxylate transport system substrate-binding protein